MLRVQLASTYARVALANIEREYPRRLDQVLTGPDTEWRPRILHPAFYGSYDWHSAVHMHWSLARILRLYPDIDCKTEIERVLGAHFEPRIIAKELAFFRTPGAASFERPYGWAWFLALDAELIRLGRWAENTAPLARHLALRLADYVTSLPYAIRAGSHGNTAFACVLAWDYAEAAGDEALRVAIRESAKRWYGLDEDYPIAYEPSGDDFLSPALTEALLMEQVLPSAEFQSWWKRFLPEGFGLLTEPPRVNDHADAKQSHLDGLCLSRAWCLKRLGYRDLARRHLEAGLPYVVGGDYAGEHWLASFAVLALSAADLKTP